MRSESPLFLLSCLLSYIGDRIRSFFLPQLDLLIRLSVDTVVRTYTSLEVDSRCLVESSLDTIVRTYRSLGVDSRCLVEWPGTSVTRTTRLVKRSARRTIGI